MFSNRQITFTRKAGRVFTLLGWLSLIMTALIGVAVAIPMMAEGAGRVGSSEITLLVSITGVLFLLSVLYLWVGSALKKHRQWARNAGALLAFLSLVNVPIGTLIAFAVLYYLHKGWNEAPLLT
ncbi:hypothetical protein [Marinobacter sp. OP 3.4]|uniref:hypothetical protein n=1 Tax=Marinobacter sp. OP 3.4 TaxID=3076501 RepID=UPI002E1B052B